MSDTTTLNVSELAARLRAGEVLIDICTETGASYSTLRSRLSQAGYDGTGHPRTQREPGRRVGSTREGMTGNQIGGGERALSTDPVIYGRWDPKPRPTGLDWSAHRAPDAPAVDEAPSCKECHVRPVGTVSVRGWCDQCETDAEAALHVEPPKPVEVGPAPAPETGEEVEAPHTTDASEASMAGDDHPSPNTLPNLMREEGAGGEAEGEAAEPPAPGTEVLRLMLAAGEAVSLARAALDDAFTALTAAAAAVPPTEPLAATVGPVRVEEARPRFETFQRPPAKRRARAPRTTVDRDVVLQRYADGQTVGAIAAALGGSTSTVRRILVGNGVTLRDDRVTNSGRVRSARTPDVDAEIRRLYVDERLSQAQVADQLGVARQTVVRSMAEQGIEGRRGETGRMDGAVGLKARMAELGVTSADVRTWARDEGLEVTDRGLPTAALVEQWAAAHEAVTT